jgi:hypothetical protein
MMGNGPFMQYLRLVLLYLSVNEVVFLPQKIMSSSLALNISKQSAALFP